MRFLPAFLCWIISHHHKKFKSFYAFLFFMHIMYRKFFSFFCLLKNSLIS